MDLYASLPEDTQAHVRGFFHVWQRYGFKEQPEVLRGFPWAYYSCIRQAPPSFRWMPPHRFSYRRQRDTYEWYLRLKYGDTDTEDYWHISMYPQWEYSTEMVSRTKKLLHTRFFMDVPFPPCASLVHTFVTDDTGELVLYFTVRRPSSTSPPTTQATLDAFALYIKQLAVNVNLALEQCSY